MVVSNRIRTVVEMVTSCCTVADIGCDHCLSLIYLIKNGLCQKGIGTDIKKGPLSVAKDNVIRYGLQSKIELRQGNGLSPLKTGEVNAIIIAGMGGFLINDIINEGEKIAKSVCELVIQPNRDVFAVRRNLHSSGFKIIDEMLVCEQNKYYFTLKATPGLEWYENEAEYLFGRILIKRKSDILKQYLNIILKKNQEVENRLAHKRTYNCVFKLTELNRMNRIIREVLLCL